MKQPIFYDTTGKRWRKIKIIGYWSFSFIIIYSLLNVIIYFSIGSIPTITAHMLSFLLKTIAVYFFLSIVIGISRSLFLMYFSLRQKYQRRHFLKKNNIYYVNVSVIIPAYNEEMGIERTIKSILNSHYPISEIIVVDDGSTDRTAHIVKRSFRYDYRVKLIQKKNGGKSSALNLGIKRASGEIIVTIDADNIFLKNTIAYLVSHFKNPNVAAVSGNCKIGNIFNQLTIWQHIEYITANNFEKRALDYLNCMTVIPGSNSAWRKSIFDEVGLFTHDTLAEDTDMTLNIISRNYRILYDERAVSIEECPENTHGFVRQRLRWSYGILQSLWKNRNLVLLTKNKTLKYFAIPSMLMTYLFYLTVPFVDLFFIFTLIKGHYFVFFFVLFFFLTDSIVSLFAFMLEKENTSPLKWLFFQRIAYRYFYTYETWKSFILALKGSGLTWQNISRTGNHLK